MSQEGEAMNTVPFISIIVTASKRSDIVSFAMKSIGCLGYPRDRVEVILADNGRSRVIDDFSAFLPFPFTYLNAAGRSMRNTAVREARGDFILFLNDDVIPEVNLLHAHMSAHARFPKSIILGEVLPRPGAGILERLTLRSFSGAR